MPFGGFGTEAIHFVMMLRQEGGLGMIGILSCGMGKEQKDGLQLVLP